MFVQGPRPENILFLIHEVFESIIEESFNGVSYDLYLPCPDCLLNEVSHEVTLATNICMNSLYLQNVATKYMYEFTLATKCIYEFPILTKCTYEFTLDTLLF